MTALTLASAAKGAAERPTAPFVPIPGRFLQRKCACGAVVGAKGECDECARGHAAAEAREREQPVGSHSWRSAGCHSLARMTIYPPATAHPDGERGDREQPITGVLPDEHGGEAVEQSTGGSSQCNLAGDSQTITNNNDECTRPCTQEHEEDHVRHRSACCESARAAYHAAGSSDDRNRIMRRWNQWVRDNQAASECSAYRVSVACATRMQNEHNCANQPSVCCEQIRRYLAHVTERRTHHCDQSGGSTNRTPCPDFS